MNAPPSSPTPIKCRGQTIVFRPPYGIDVNQLLLKYPYEPPSSSLVTSFETQEQHGLPILDSAKRTEVRAKRKRVPTWIIKTGDDHPYQRLEVFSSSASSNAATNSTSPNSKRSSERGVTPSPINTEPIDWIDFADPEAAYAEYGSMGNHPSFSEESWSSDDDISTIIITPKTSQAAPRMVLTPQQLASLFHQPIQLATPPPTPPQARVRRVSRSPCLPTIPASAPNSPTRDNPPMPASPSSRSAPGRIFDLSCSRQNWSPEIDTTVSFPEPEEVTIGSGSQDRAEKGLQCSACGKCVELKKANKMIPCGHVTCSVCFSSTLSAVSPARTHSQCVACAGGLITFERIKRMPYQDGRSPASEEVVPVVMRIDNIAWDMTPDIVENFLPPNTLSTEVHQAIHIPLDRFDGRTKDYLYIETASLEAAKKILQSRQNSYMPGGPGTGGKKRPVPITIVSEAELISELRPQSTQELHCLLNLCHLALGPPIAAARFVKSRHGPFYALMSILSKLSGQNSPAYWDLFHIASGQTNFHLQRRPLTD
ncbi:uncharacterized protein I206_104162 [Kwoniella pini CBS 10737]|uniref:RING-type domain-containing protein n=1 Tax=Kwoniella pini CBS 10737 TaxID=1296096 RepID=A0A1B9I2I1_9TREE|nr:uncharacterized protein I206_04263 [Kwoniella pini CBS 10737]OCF49739.1 hypothetical protein I206_04263 [Kwoniella pini CBS 10737]